MERGINEIKEVVREGNNNINNNVNNKILVVNKNIKNMKKKW